MSNAHSPPAKPEPRAAANREEVMDALRRCYDPCCRERAISVVDMGLIDKIHVDGSHVGVDMILTTGWCPFSLHLIQMMEEEVGRLAGVAEVSVNIVWHTPWTPDRMSEEARNRLRLPMEQLIPLREARLARDAAHGNTEGGSR